MSTDPADGAPTSSGLAFSSHQGRLLLLITILASGMGFLDGTVVNVALPKIEDELGGGFATIQWVLDAYLLTLGSLVLVGGSLGDLWGRKRMFLWGVAGFAVASLLCAVAPSATVLIAARAVQGVAAALMIPGSLALLSSLFRAEDRGRAIGLWSGLSSLVTALGPFVGGLLVDSGPGGWRWAFVLNLPLALLVLWLARGVPESRPEVDQQDPSATAPATNAVSDRGSVRGGFSRRVDILGAVLITAGLALVITPLIEAEHLPNLMIAALLGVGVILLILYWIWERRRERQGSPAPMMPTTLWRIRSFTMANLITFFVYAALGAILLFFAIGFQIGLGWSALAAGAAGLPITVILTLFSSKIGSLLPRFGSRPLLSFGAGLMAVGSAGLALISPGTAYWSGVLPWMLVFAVGLAFMVAPITTTALGDIPVASSGVGSGVNNAVARIAGLIAIALVPLAAGLTNLDASAGAAVLPGYRRAMLICAGLMAFAAVLSWLGFSRETGRVAEPSGAGQTESEALQNPRDG